eukprot:1810510-Rhodomonas_salina.1
MSREGLRRAAHEVITPGRKRLRHRFAMQLRMRNAIQPDLCPHCGALLFEEECFSASWCCKDSELDAMYRLRPLPPELVDMWVAEAK